jgi:hypothetical protein
MSKDDIIRMAREAGAEFAELPMMDAWLFYEEEYLERFAALVAAAERDKFCAVLRQLHDSYSLASTDAPRSNP